MTERVRGMKTLCCLQVREIIYDSARGERMAKQQLEQFLGSVTVSVRISFLFSFFFGFLRLCQSIKNYVHWKLSWIAINSFIGSGRSGVLQKWSTRDPRWFVFFETVFFSECNIIVYPKSYLQNIVQNRSQAGQCIAQWSRRGEAVRFWSVEKATSITTLFIHFISYLIN